MSNKSVFLLLLLADKDSFRIRPLFTDPNATPIGTITGRKRWQLLCIESYQTFSRTSPNPSVIFLIVGGEMYPKCPSVLRNKC